MCLLTKLVKLNFGKYKKIQRVAYKFIRHNFVLSSFCVVPGYFPLNFYDYSTYFRLQLI